MSASDRTESETVEHPALHWFADLGWETFDGNGEIIGASAATSTLGRTDRRDVFLPDRLQSALKRLNPDLPNDVLNRARAALTRRRGTLSTVHANQQIHTLLTDGIPVDAVDATGRDVRHTVRVIDWSAPATNDFLVVQQFRVQGEVKTYRPDLVGFVNGIPMVLLELKSPRHPVREAYNDNLTRYRKRIPHLLAPNGLVILSNRTDARVGSTTAPWEHFGQWKKMGDEDETPRVSLKRTLRAVCDPGRLLDLVENFVVYSDQGEGTEKLLAKYHQYHGVNRTVDALRNRDANANRLGVFWHTQGSGKSLSMVFFAGKVRRTMPGNWTFVVVTDRVDLDDQIYKTFARAGVLTESQEKVRAQSTRDLRMKLQEDHTVLFTLIQKFRTEGGATHPTLTKRNDVIVMTDEAHRSQYDEYAGNMRTALPNAAFLGFTGTPLKADQEHTKHAFGEYVSVYDFKDAIDDGATVPIYYENRIPQLQLTNEDFSEDMDALLDAVALDEAEERALEREFSQQYHLLTREDRLDTVGEDIVDHFLGRGYRGKAMVISLDKATAVRTYDAVQRHWQRRLNVLREKREAAEAGSPEAERLDDEVEYVRNTDMAVVVSESATEVEDLAEKGANIRPHRERMNTEDLDEAFKDADDPLRIVFVCAKWITGFDVKPCSTIYLDKPMRNHTLMQAVARANRVFGEKPNGLIVDYVGVFRNLQEALALYTSGAAEGVDDDDPPILPKKDLLDALEEAIADAQAFALTHDVDIQQLETATGDAFGSAIEDAVDQLVRTDDVKHTFHDHARRVDRLYRAVLPDPDAQDYRRAHFTLQYVDEAIQALRERPDISNVMQQVELLLDDSVAAEPYLIRDPSTVTYDTDAAVPRDEAGRINLRDIDTEELRDQFENGPAGITAERLRRLLETRIQRLTELNSERIDYQKRLESMIENYNAGSHNQEQHFQMLLSLMDDLQDEEERTIRENLTEAELALFDILRAKPAPELTDEERESLKRGARTLVETLKEEKLVLDWRQKQKARSTVRKAIEIVLDEHLPQTYGVQVYDTKVNAVYEHVYEKYYGPNGKNFYNMVA